MRPEALATVLSRVRAACTAWQFVPQPHTLWRVEEQGTQGAPAAAASLPLLATSQEALDSLHSLALALDILPESLESPPVVVPASQFSTGRIPQAGPASRAGEPAPICKFFVNSGVCFYGACTNCSCSPPCLSRSWECGLRPTVRQLRPPPVGSPPRLHVN